MTNRSSRNVNALLTQVADAMGELTSILQILAASEQEYACQQKHEDKYQEAEVSQFKIEKKSEYLLRLKKQNSLKAIYRAERMNSALVRLSDQLASLTSTVRTLGRSGK